MIHRGQEVVPMRDIVCRYGITLTKSPVVVEDVRVHPTRGLQVLIECVSPWMPAAWFTAYAVRGE